MCSSDLGAAGVEHVRGVEQPCTIASSDPEGCDLPDSCLDAIGKLFDARKQLMPSPKGAYNENALFTYGASATCAGFWNKNLVDLVVHHKACPLPDGWNALGSDEASLAALAALWRSTRYRQCWRAIRQAPFKFGGEHRGIHACNPAGTCAPYAELAHPAVAATPAPCSHGPPHCDRVGRRPQGRA